MQPERLGVGPDDGDVGLGGLRRLDRQHRDGAQQVLALGADDRERRANGSDLALAHDDTEDDAGDGRADLDGRLVRLDLDDGVVLAHRLALAHEPARDLALGQAFAQIRQRERVGHAGRVVPT